MVDIPVSRVPPCAVEFGLMSKLSFDFYCLMPIRIETCLLPIEHAEFAYPVS